MDAPCLQRADSDATAVVSSSPSQTSMRTVQQERKGDQEKEGAPAA